VKKWSVPNDQWNGYIRKAPNQVAKFAIWLGFNFGLRLGEIIHLRIDDVDFERKLILIREHKATKNQEAWNPKYNRSREVPFNRKQEKVLKKWITQRISLEHPYLLWNPRSGQYFGHPISGRSIQRWCQLIHGDLRPHVLRYSFATHYFLAGVNLKTLSLVLGHSSVAITSEYLEIDKQQGFEEMRGSMGA
jgi:integrase